MIDKINDMKRGLILKIYELTEDIRDTSITRDICDICKISQKLSFYTEFITDVNFTDFNYVKIVLDKSKTMLCTINFIFEHYFNETLQKEKGENKNG